MYFFVYRKFIGIQTALLNIPMCLFLFYKNFTDKYFPIYFLLRVDPCRGGLPCLFTILPFAVRIAETQHVAGLEWSPSGLFAASKKADDEFHSDIYAPEGFSHYTNWQKAVYSSVGTPIALLSHLLLFVGPCLVQSSIASRSERKTLSHPH